MTKIGSEFRINTYTTGDQLEPSVIGLNNRDFVDKFNLISSTVSSPRLTTPVDDSSFSGSGKVLSSVPAYKWYHGCGPTAVASVIGYWDLFGYSNLFDARGDDVFLTENIQDHISSPEHNAKYNSTPDDPNLPVPSFTSIADWFQTSVDPLKHGLSYLSYADDAFTGYMTYRGYNFETINNSYSSQLWNDLVLEIDSGHPAMFSVDTDGNGSTDHSVPVLGYDDRGSEGQFYGLYTTWSEDESVVWKPFQGLGNSWGVGVATFVRPQPQLSVTNVSPVPNTVSSSLDSEIIIEFDDTISGSAKSSEIVISSNQRGIIPGIFTGGEGSNEITFTPDKSLKEGEQISVTITNSIAGNIVEPYNYSFLVEATAGNGSFSDSDRYSINSDVENNYQYTDDLVVADLDNDGDLDLVSANYNQGNRIYFNDGNGTFIDSGQSLTTYGTDGTAKVADLDNDGDLDLIFASGWLDNVYQPNQIYWNNGNGIFTDSGQSLGGQNLDHDIEVGDLDLDGDLDLVFLNHGYYGTGNQIYWNNGTGTFSYSGQSVGGQSGTAMAMGDIDNDGDLDIVIIDWNKIDIAINDGTGTFTNSNQSVEGEYSSAVAMADLDQDGDLDLAVGYETAGNRIFFNDGTGTFTDSNQSLGEIWTNEVAVGDVDSDGDLDLVFANTRGSDSNSISYNGENKVYLNDGTGTFIDSGLSLSPYTSSSDVEIADINNDGDLDLIFSYWGQNKVYVNQQLPIAVDDNFTSDEDQVLNGNVLVDNGKGADNDGDGDTLTVTANTDPANGTLTINSNGNFTYTPHTNFDGNDSFEYTIDDGHGGTDTATVNLTINSVDDPPEVINAIANVTVSEDDFPSWIILDENTPDNPTLNDVFSDVDEDEITISVLNNTNPDLVVANIAYIVADDFENGISWIDTILELNYQPDQFGTADITIQAEANGEIVEETFMVNVNPVDDAPEVINPIADIIVEENAEFTDININDVFTDLEGDTINISVFENTNPDLVLTELIVLPCGCNPKLYSFILESQPNQSGIAKITLQAESNGQVVYDDFTVTVQPIARFDLDIDGNGQYSAAVDGLLTYGYMNVRNLPYFLRDNLTQQIADNLINPNGNVTRKTGAEIADYLESNIQYLDIDDDGEISAGIDGLLVYGYMNVRNLPDFLRDNLTQQLADNLIPDDSDATRRSGAEIADYLEQFIF